MPGSLFGAVLFLALLQSPAPPTSLTEGDGRGVPTLLSVDPCLGAEREEVRRLVSRELGVQLVETSSRASGLRVRIGCEGEHAIALTVDDPITRKSLGRTVELGLAPRDGQARLLALAVAELVAASWTELEANPEPKVRPIGAPVEPEWLTTALSSVRRRERLYSLELRATAGVLHFPRAPGPFPSAGLRLGGHWTSMLGWVVELTAFHGREVVSARSIGVNGATGAAALGVRQRYAAIELRAGLGFRGGVAALGGRSTSTAVGQTIFGPWAGPIGTVSVLAPLFEILLLEVSVEGGYSPISVVGLLEGRSAVEIGGPWVAAHGGVGLLFW